MLENWRGLLDDRACAILEEAGMEVAGHVLQELKEKLDNGYDIKNPSSYAYRAVTNAMQRTGCTRPGQLSQSGWLESARTTRVLGGPPPAKASRGPPDPNISEAHQAARDSLDDKTLRGLDGLSEEDRSSILDDLISKSDVRNPSAFVYRAVTNLQHRRAPPVTS